MEIQDSYRTVAQKSGNGLMIWLPIKLIRDLELEERDEVKFVMQKTGKKIKKVRSLPESWKKRIYNKPEDVHPKAEPTKPIEKPAVSESPGTFVV